MSERDKYRVLLNTADYAYACHQIFTDSAGNPTDLIYLKVNQANEELMNTSRGRMVGCRAASW